MFGVYIVDPKADPECEKCHGEGVRWRVVDGREGFYDCPCKEREV